MWYRGKTWDWKIECLDFCPITPLPVMRSWEVTWSAWAVVSSFFQTGILLRDNVLRGLRFCTWKCYVASEVVDSIKNVRRHFLGLFTEGVLSACVLRQRVGLWLCSERWDSLLESLLPSALSSMTASSHVCCLHFNINIQYGLNFRSSVTLTVSGAQQWPCWTVHMGSIPLLKGGFVVKLFEGEMCDEWSGLVNSEKCWRW